MSVAQRVLGRVALVAVSSLVAFVLIEVLVRVGGLDQPMLWRPDPQLGWWHVPAARMRWREEGDGLVQINEHLMRDPPRSPDKAPGVFRIAVFGDSMTEAVQVNLDQTYTQLLEKRYRDSGLKVEVLNFGVNGYSALQELLLYRRVGPVFKPDVVIHAVFVDNDVAATDPALATGQVGAPFLPHGKRDAFDVDFSRAVESSEDYAKQPKALLRDWSAVYRLAGAIRRRRGGNSEFEAATAAQGGVPKRHQLYLTQPATQWNEAWLTFGAVLKTFESEVRSAGARYLILNVPAGQVVDTAAWQEVIREFPAMKSKEWDLENPDRRLAEIGSALQVPVINVLRPFREALGSGPLFFNGLGHLTPQGHAVLARALEASLTDLAAVPTARR